MEATICIVTMGVVVGGCTVAAPESGQTDASPGRDVKRDANPSGPSVVPRPGTSWQWQLSGELDTSLDVDMYNVDLFDTPAETILKLHRDGRMVICHFSAGTHQRGRADADAFPLAALGEVREGWPGEHWLDIRNSQVRTLMSARMDLAVTRGCDGVAPDHVDGFAHRSGFPLTAADQREFNLFLVSQAHSRLLSVGLKNNPIQVTDLVQAFDWALSEECLALDTCDQFAQFIALGKAVFHVEYGDTNLVATACPQSRAFAFDGMIKRRRLDAWRIACGDI
ncbi:MAG: endo alpha-1,4 polygalactosaminidase [Proteobacteria bacterium]|nr:endo alpha-1,4 polygalactosaminidase [Pseudomonadota bacterium]